MRRDVSQPQNIAWLLRNLPINNSQNSRLGEVITELKRLHTPNGRNNP